MSQHRVPKENEYFVLSCDGPYPPTALGRIPDLPGPPWMTGRPITIDVPDPLVFELDPHYPGEMLPLYVDDIPLMRDDLLEVLKGTGVDNLQLFNAVVRNTKKRVAHTNYKAFNIVGVIAAADLPRSTLMFPQEPHMVDMMFDSLAIDESKIGGPLMFRLAESVNAIMVHRRIKDAVAAAAIVGMVFYDPEDWAG